MSLTGLAIFSEKLQDIQENCNIHRQRIELKEWWEKNTATEGHCSSGSLESLTPPMIKVILRGISFAHLWLVKRVVERFICDVLRW